MRAIWSGVISFGLLNIPVKLYSATNERNLNLDMLRKDDLCPIKFARVCRSTGEEVPYDQIVKGYEYSEGDYVVLDKEDFEKVDAKRTNSIDITEFVSESEIDTKYYEKPYYLEPGKGADKAYALLRDALKKSKKVAVATYVLRTKENLAVLKADNDAIILNQLRFDFEIRKPEELKLPVRVEASNKELDMAIQLINQLSGTFKPTEFKDEYREELEKIIKLKAEGKQLKETSKAPLPTKAPDLMAALRNSLEHAQNSRYASN